MESLCDYMPVSNHGSDERNLHSMKGNIFYLRAKMNDPAERKRGASKTYFISAGEKY
jgi:hypothetical protein